MKNSASSVNNGRPSVSSTKLQLDDISMNELTTKSEITSHNSLLSGQFAQPLILLILVTIILSLILLVIPSCNEVSLQVKVWGVSYQLIKKDDCRGAKR